MESDLRQKASLIVEAVGEQRRKSMFAYVTLLLCCPARQQRHLSRWVAKSQRNDEKSLRSAYSSSSSLSFATPPPPLTPTILKIHKLNQVILMLITHFAGTEAPRPPEAEVVLAVEVLL